MNRSGIPDKNRAEIGEWNTDVLDELLPKIYGELKRLAAFHLKKERPDHTLSPTELVHEVYVLLRSQHSLDLKDRKQFFNIASSVMRRVLINYAIRRKRKKRNDGKYDLHIDDVDDLTLITFERRIVDVIALEDALKRLEKMDERQVKIVELHSYGGLTFEEIADVLDISERTVMRDWRLAKVWLYKRLKETL